jgi:hypothetical protein
MSDVLAGSLVSAARSAESRDMDRRLPGLDRAPNGLSPFLLCATTRPADEFSRRMPDIGSPQLDTVRRRAPAPASPCLGIASRVRSEPGRCLDDAGRRGGGRCPRPRQRTGLRTSGELPLKHGPYSRYSARPGWRPGHRRSSKRRAERCGHACHPVAVRHRQSARRPVRGA